MLRSKFQMAIILFGFSSGLLAEIEITKPKYYRFYSETVFFVGMENVGSNSFGGGLQYKLGNKWYLNKNCFHGFLKLTWFRLGIYGGEASGLILTPAILGIGHQFGITDNFSIEPSVNSGIIIGTDDLLGPSWEFEWAVIPDLFFSFNRFRIGIEYTFKRIISKSSNEVIGHFHYFGLVVGRNFRIVKNINSE